MNIKKIIFLFFATGCSTQVHYVDRPVCPYGPPYMTQKDYITLSNSELISDQIAEWIIVNGEFCERMDK